jgi:DnaD/phage-associated family protein
MKYRREPGEGLYLLDTGVENIFLHEYMVPAPGAYVKVYLIGLMYAEAGLDMDGETLARMLSMEPGEVEKAWRYWEGLGVVRRSGEEIIFLSLKACLYGKKHQEAPRKNPNRPSDILEDASLKGLFQTVERTVGRPLSGTETAEILGWMDENGASPEIIAYAYAYCVSKKKDNPRYVGAVVRGWAESGLSTITEVERHLADNDQRHYAYKRVMQALGFTRNATEEEKRLMDGWFDKLGCDMDEVLAACGKTSGIANPNINYVNKILENRRGTGGNGSRGAGPAPVAAYYEFLREKARREAEERRSAALERIPALADLEEELRRLSVELSRTLVSGGPDKTQKAQEIKAAADAANRRKAALLTEASLPADFLELRYACGLCRDTGTKDNGEQCECVLARTKEASEWSRES